MTEKKYDLILASRSPRRRQILKEAGIFFRSMSSNSSELFDENLTLDENLVQIAKTKVQGTMKRLNRRHQKKILILGADTVVALGKRIFGKPKNIVDATRMMRLLSGKTHCVKTGFAILNAHSNKWVTRVVSSRVRFRKLSKEEIRWYVHSGEPFDKAGGYGIQGLAQHFVSYMDGDLLNVVGLPLHAIRNELRKKRWSLKYAQPQESPSPRYRKNRNR